MAGEYSNKTAACIIHRCIGAVLLLVLDKLSTSVSSLTPCQLDALKAFIMGTDTFVSLPTGHGKSLIYQIALPVVKELVKTYREELSQCFPSRPMLLVVSPLNALITDQMEQRFHKIFAYSCLWERTVRKKNLDKENLKRMHNICTTLAPLSHSNCLI